MKRFCVLATGRSGSTALMDSLYAHDDIGVPLRQFPLCVDNELIHPMRNAQAARTYHELTGLPVRNEVELVRAFYAANKSFNYAGFKTMPNRLHQWQELSQEPDTTWITIRRLDIPSTAASFILAWKHGTWRREGEPQELRYTFGPEQVKSLRGNLAYLRESFRLIDALPNAIHLTFEDFCIEGHSDDRVDEFFGRKISFLNPRPPRSASEYVTNWDEFRAFIDAEWAKLT